jgi:hypothetical protein
MKVSPQARPAVVVFALQHRAHGLRARESISRREGHMPRTSSTASADESSDAQGRFAVGLPKDVGKQIDALSAKMAAAMQEQYGIGVELSRAQVVTSVVKSALAAFDAGQVAAGNGGDES